ncbi:hypothetical protein IW140_001150 [Coemansia sp. RSA 1813]|nr:hypothetical protein EV178_002375 [Coemansia sp. RSA 1646]KAJ1773180.1 hypothetical protein LPJ74_000919 [Coemansia sp. RSA 1843]KAJ2092057.1 hypothetical protein IW138_001423 [Coemansia sp. RSA 986]KAJ2216607.1 hypothetical protein EV179_001146 [Coemansia sp. RSA 487]KAJ2572110.1 hypothetical protein IW140_001150 [Coemansia sp. RSA 1813]
MLSSFWLAARTPTRKCMAQASYFHKQTAASAPGLFGRLFGGKDKKSKQDNTLEGQKTSVPESDIPIQPVHGGYETGVFRYREPLKLKFLKRDMPLEWTERHLKNVLRICNIKVDEADWKTTQLTQRDVKLRVISEAIRKIKIPIHNRALNNINTAGDLLEEFVQKPVQRDAGHPVAIFYKENADKLPPNMKFESFEKRKRKLHVDQ